MTDLANLALLRLKDLSKDDFLFGRTLISTFRSPERPLQEQFLRKYAVKWEKSKCASTYILMDTVTETALGFFTINAGCRCVYDRPVFEIGHLCANSSKSARLDSVLIDFVMQLLLHCNRYIGDLDITVTCENDLIETYRSKGFRLISRTVSGQNRLVMRL